MEELKKENRVGTRQKTRNIIIRGIKVKSIRKRGKKNPIRAI